MKNISILALSLLTSCSAIEKNESSIKKIAHDVVDEAIDRIDEKKKSKGEKNENGMVVLDSSFDELHLLYQYGSYARRCE